MAKIPQGLFAAAATCRRPAGCINHCRDAARARLVDLRTGVYLQLQAQCAGYVMGKERLQSALADGQHHLDREHHPRAWEDRTPTGERPKRALGYHHGAAPPGR